MPEERPLEVELKLATDGGSMDLLLASPLLREHARSTIRSRQLVSVYYDTSDRRLTRRGIAFRVRQNGRRFIQTLKTGNVAQGAAAARGEWEVELPDARPQLAAFDDPAVLDLVGLVLPGELQPLFETRFRRQALMVEWADGQGPPARIEIACDRGVIKAGAHEAPISEIELELKEGEPRTLFELAQVMRDLAPLRLEPLDKAMRGHALAAGEPPPWRRAAPVEVAAATSVDEALERILGGCMRHWLDNEAAARDGRDSEGLHQLRVALRRLRSAFTILKPALGDAAKARWGEELRWLLQPLGPARDLDVFAADLLIPARAGFDDDPALAALERAVAASRARAQAEVRDTLASTRYADLALRLACWIGCRGWRQAADVDLLLVQRQPLGELAATVLDRRWRQVRKRGRHFADLDAPARHELRIALKKLRYGVEFFAALHPKKKVKRFRKAAARMQDLLGHQNDIAVARDLAAGLLERMEPGLDQRLAGIGAGQVIGWHARRAADGEDELRGAWAAFQHEKPYWRSKG